MNKEEIKDWINYIELVDNELRNSKTKDIRETYIYKLQQENKQLKEIINKAISYIKSHKETREHYEPYGTPMGNPNYTTTHVFGYYELLEIFKGE